MTTITRISKRDENVEKLGTSPRNSSSGDSFPSPHTILTSKVINHDGDDFKYSLSAPIADLERVVHVDTKDLVDPSSEHAQLGDDLSSEHGLKQSPVRSGDQDPCSTAADPGVAYKHLSTDEPEPSSPLFSPLFPPIDHRQLDVTVKPQAAATPILPVPSRARGETQVTEASVSRPPQSSIIDDTSSTTAVAGSMVKQSKSVSVKDLLPVCALDIDFLSAKPRAASAPLHAQFDSSSLQTQHASSAHEVKQYPTADSSASNDRQKWKPTGSAVSRDRGSSFATYVGLSGNVQDPSSTDPGLSTNRTSNGRSKQNLAKVGTPITPVPLSESSTSTTFDPNARFLSEMSEAEKQNLDKIIDNCIQATGLLSAPKDLISRSRMQKRKRNKNTQATTSTIGPDSSQPAIPDKSSMNTLLTDSQEAAAPKPKRKRTSKPKKNLPIVENPYPINPHPRTTTTPPEEVPQQDFPFNEQQVQGIRSEIPPASMPLVNPASMAPVNVSRSDGGLDLATKAPTPAFHGNDFTVNNSLAAPAYPSAFEHVQSTALGSTPYSLNFPRNFGINHPQGIIPGAAHPTGPAYHPVFMNPQQLFWQRAQMARQMEARWQAELTDGRYHAPFIPNAMSMPTASEGGWGPQRPDISSQPLAAAGSPHFFDAAQSTQAASGQPRTHSTYPSNVYPQYQVPSFDHNIQSGPYHMLHPLFNQGLAGPSLQPDVFNPPAFNGHPMSHTRYESPFPPIHLGREWQSGTEYVRPAVPAGAPVQNYSHGLDPLFGNHAVAPINLHDNLTRRQIPAATSLKIPFIDDEPTNGTG